LNSLADSIIIIIIMSRSYVTHTFVFSSIQLLCNGFGFHMLAWSIYIKGYIGGIVRGRIYKNIY
ncbi:hypothetical protein ACJX0J_018479, partial [Zea mays]